MKSIQLLKKDLSGLNDQAVADPEEFQGFAQTLSISIDQNNSVYVKN